MCTVTGLRWNSLPLIDVTYCYVSTAPLSGAHDVPSVITLTSDATFCASYNRSIMHATLQQPRGRPPECVLTAVLRGSIKSAVLCCAVPCRAVPCRAVALRRTAWSEQGMGAAWAWYGKCESDTAALCKSNGKDTF